MKKLYLLLLAVLFIPFMGNAQFSEDFDNVSTPAGIGNLPTGWTTYDEDGLIPNSNVAPLFDKAWKVINFQGWPSPAAASTSAYTPAGQSDDWMVTPQITVPNTSPFLLFEAAAYTSSAPDDYEVLISTTGNTPADFSTVIHSETTPPSSYIPVAVDLSAYAGQQVYIAFHNIANNEFILMIDNISVSSLAAGDVALTAVELVPYSATSVNNNLTVTVKNFGSSTVNSIDITWNDGTNTHTYTATGLNLTPYTSTTITHDTPVNYVNVVEKTISIDVANPNGNTDPDLSDNTDNTPFHTVSQVSTKYVVIEEGTGTWCQYCPRGIVAMEHMYANPTLFPNFIGIAVHQSYSSNQGIDPMQLDEYIIGANFSSFPGSNIDRVILGAGVTKDLWVDIYNARKDVIAPGSVGITSSYDPNTREVTASVTADIYTNYAQADLRFAVVLVEDGVTGTTSGYAQVNAYSGSDVSMGGFENLPNPVPASQMVYDRVGIALLGGYEGEAGSIASTIADGDSFNYSFTYTLPNDVDASEVKVVALLLDNETGAILNASELDPQMGVVENPVAVNNIQVYPNPASNFVHVSFGMQVPDDVRLNIYSMTGAIVKTQNFEDLNGNQEIQVDISGLSVGQYLVSLATDEGAVVKKIVVE